MLGFRAGWLSFGFLLLLSISNVSVLNARILREMKISEIPDGQSAPHIIRQHDEAALIVYSTIAQLKFQSNNRILRVHHAQDGKWILHLSPGTHLITVQADGFASLQERIVLRAREYREVRISPSGPTNEKTDWGRAEFILSPGAVIVFVDSIQSGQFTVDADRILRLKLYPGPHTVKLIRLGSGTFETSFTVSTEEIYRDTVEFTGAADASLSSPAQSGVLLVKSDPPQADVYVDGALAEPTPYQMREIAVGEHRIRIEKAMYRPVTRQVTIEANALTTIEETLTPDFAELRIDSDPPGAETFIDGKFVGSTPFHAPAVASGSHVITLRKRYFHDLEYPMQIIAGRDRDTLVSLKPAFGSLNIACEPNGADVFLDGRDVGSTPLTIDTLSSGNYTLVVQKDRYGTLDTTVNIQDGRTTQITSPLRANFGVIAISTEPSGVNVRLDGPETLSGKTPLTEKAKPGLYILSVVDERYAAPTRQLSIPAGDSVSINLGTLNRKTGILKVFTEPIEADVFLDGLPLGKSPIVLDTIPTGSHLVEARLKKHVSDSQTIVVSNNAVTQVDLSLRAGGAIVIISGVSGDGHLPDDATIRVDGETVSGSRLDGLAPGNYLLSINVPGHQAFRRNVKVVGGETTRVEYTAPKKEIVRKTGKQKKATRPVPPPPSLAVHISGSVGRHKDQWITNNFDPPVAYRLAVGVPLGRHVELRASYKNRLLKEPGDSTGFTFAFTEIMAHFQLSTPHYRANSVAVFANAGIGQVSLQFEDTFGSTSDLGKGLCYEFGAGLAYYTSRTFGLFVEFTYEADKLDDGVETDVWYMASAGVSVAY